MKENILKKIVISLILVSVLASGCSRYIRPTTLEEAINYMGDPHNECSYPGDKLSSKAEYCDYAYDLYNTAERSFRQKLMDDPKIIKLLFQIKSQKIDCEKIIPNYPICMAIKLRIDQISDEMTKKFGLSTKPDIFISSPSFIQQELDHKLHMEEAKKLLN